VKTFEEIFCAEHRCDPAQFSRKLFWKTLPLHVAPVAVLLGGFGSRYFAADRKLLDGLRQAEDMHDVRSQINDYLAEAAERGWLLAAAGIEISIPRLKTFARYHLPGAGGKSSDPFGVFQKIES
jgi:hypothetical protein